MSRGVEPLVLLPRAGAVAKQFALVVQALTAARALDAQRRPTAAAPAAPAGAAPAATAPPAAKAAAAAGAPPAPRKGAAAAAAAAAAAGARGAEGVGDRDPAPAYVDPWTAPREGSGGPLAQGAGGRQLAPSAVRFCAHCLAVPAVLLRQLCGRFPRCIARLFGASLSWASAWRSCWRQPNARQPKRTRCSHPAWVPRQETLALPCSGAHAQASMTVS
jgi:hypothetical protein